MEKIKKFLVVLISVLFVMAAFEAKAQNVQLGKEIYEKRCWGCHGMKGDGAGPAKDFLAYQSRDFTTGLYEYKSTLEDALPYDEDLIRTVADGLPRAAMPGFGDVLKEGEIKAVVSYIKTFSDRFTEEKPPAKIKVPTLPQPTDEVLAEGKKWFEELECFKCHGSAGRADGESAPDLSDDYGNPIRPANFTQPWKFNGGSTPEDIYRTVATGLIGSPMPSFGDVFDTPEETEKYLAPLAVYVASFQEQPNFKAVLKSSLVEGELPMDPADPLWQGTEKISFRLVGQIIEEPMHFTPNIDHLNVRSLNNGREIVFLLTWDDPTQSIQNGKIMVEDPDTYEMVEKMAYPDSLIIQFPEKLVKGPELPYFLGGDKENHVYIWKWSADTSKTQEMNSAGLDKEKAQPADDQELESKAGYKDGLWTLVVKRPLSTEGETDLQMQPGKFHPIAFNALDGGNDETGKKRSISTWYWLFVEKPTPSNVYIWPPVAIVFAVVLQVWLSRKFRKAF